MVAMALSKQKGLKSNGVRLLHEAF